MKSTPARKWFHKLARYLWHEWVRPMALVAVVVFPFKSAIADWNWVPSGSMKPTILEGDLVFVNKLAYDLKVPFTVQHIAQWKDPERGDIIVFFSPADGTRLVKRVIAGPGDSIEMRNNALFLNGERMNYEPAMHVSSPKRFTKMRARWSRKNVAMMARIWSLLCLHALRCAVFQRSLCRLENILSWVIRAITVSTPAILAALIEIRLSDRQIVSCCRSTKTIRTSRESNDSFPRSDSNLRAEATGFQGQLGSARLHLCQRARTLASRKST
jgi:signal peptidase I